MTRKIVVGPFNRVEGDLEVHLEIGKAEKGERIQAAYANSPLFRGFEQILSGKHPLDALTFVPRICGICSVSQSAAAAQALAQAAGVTVPRNGQLCSAVSLAIENLADHLSHFYLFFMPDFAREEYAAHTWHADIRGRFQAIQGSATRDFLPARARLMESMGFLAGKWPHTGSVQPGGSSKPVSASERVRVYSLLRGFRNFVERNVFGDTLENFAALEHTEALKKWSANHSQSDFGRFLNVAQQLELFNVGRATDRFLSYGAYALPEGLHLPAGVWHEGAISALDVSSITEDVSHALMDGAVCLPPRQGVTQPLAEKEGAYTWCKAPRVGGQVAEAGALARQMVAGHPLVRDMVALHGGSVGARVVARILEVARMLPLMEQWVLAIVPDDVFCASFELPDDTEGVGLIEAARGSLGHWLVVREGQIARYQIIAPTTWNFSPRDQQGTPGALEQALVGIPVRDGERVPVMVQHVVRSFDPCMVCTVH